MSETLAVRVRTIADRIAWRCDLHGLADEVEEMERYVKRVAHCPCCEGTLQCDPECTIKDDAPDVWYEMRCAREALGAEG